VQQIERLKAEIRRRKAQGVDMKSNAEMLKQSVSKMQANQPKKKVIKKVKESNQPKARQEVHKSEKPKPTSVSKDILVSELACRWNYALPEYPPVGVDYKPKIKEAGKKLVDLDEFAKQRIEGGKDVLVAVDNYLGLFRDVSGKCHDFRPHSDANLVEYLTARERGETGLPKLIFKPSLANFRKMDVRVLARLLVVAYREQLRLLTREDHEAYDTLYEQKMRSQIRARLDTLQKKLSTA
jgi:hypothetical protein